MQKWQEEIQKQEEIFPTSLTCPVNNWIYIEVFETAGWGLFGLISFPSLQDLKSGK